MTPRATRTRESGAVIVVENFTRANDCILHCSNAFKIERCDSVGNGMHLGALVDEHDQTLQQKLLQFMHVMHFLHTGCSASSDTMIHL